MSSWLLGSLLACAPSVEDLAREADVEVLDDTDAPSVSGTIYGLDTTRQPSLTFEANGLFGIPAGGVWTRYTVRLTEEGSTEEPEMAVRVVVDLDSLQTGIDRLDEHIRTSDYMDIGPHPQAVFRSSAIDRAGDGVFLVSGDLTLRGTTRAISFDANIARGGTVQASASIPLSRWDFGLYADDVDEPGGDGADDAFVVTFDVQLTPVSE